MLASNSTRTIVGFASAPKASRPEQTASAASRPEQTASAASKPRVEPKISPVATGLTMPQAKRRGKMSSYPFATLTEVGQCFGVADKTFRQVASMVSNQNRKNKSETKDAEGKVVSTTYEPHYVAYEVSAHPELAEQIKGRADLAGSSVLVFRDK